MQVVAETTYDDAALVAHERRIIEQLMRKSSAVVKLLEGQLGGGYGKGWSVIERMPTIAMPKSEAFSAYVILPDKFQQECGWSPQEQAVMDVMLLCRDRTMMNLRQPLTGHALKGVTSTRHASFSLSSLCTAGSTSLWIGRATSGTGHARQSTPTFFGCASV